MSLKRIYTKKRIVSLVIFLLTSVVTLFLSAVEINAVIDPKKDCYSGDTYGCDTKEKLYKCLRGDIYTFYWEEQEKGNCDTDESIKRVGLELKSCQGVCGIGEYKNKYITCFTGKNFGSEDSSRDKCKNPCVTGVDDKKCWNDILLVECISNDWREIEVCRPPNKCDDEELKCVDMSCVSGNKKCKNEIDNILLTCNPDEMSWSESTCLANQVCKNGACVTSCTKSGGLCVNMNPATCKIEGGSIISRTDCVSGEFCCKLPTGGNQPTLPPPKPPDEDSLIPEYPKEVGFKFKNQTIGSIISGLLPYLYVIAGLILLVMLIMGGLGLMTAAGNPDKMKVGYGKITNALIGFLIIFISYFVVQLVETILSIKIM